MSTQALPAIADSASAVADKASSQAPAPRENAAFIEQLKRLYSADQQTEYLFIQAEADSLLVQLEKVKTQRH